MVWPFRKKQGNSNPVKTLSEKIQNSISEILDVDHDVIKKCNLMLTTLKSAVDEINFLNGGFWGSRNVASFVAEQNLGKFKVEINKISNSCNLIETELNKELEINSKVKEILLSHNEKKAIKNINSGLKTLRGIRARLTGIYNYDKLKVLVQKNKRIQTDSDDGLELHHRLEDLHDEMVLLKHIAVQLKKLEKQILHDSKKSSK